MILSKPINIRRNLFGEEYKAFRDLRENKELQIRKADKGGEIVIMNTDDYDNKMENILNGNEYQVLTKHPTGEIERRVYKCLFKYKGLFQENIRSQLTPHHSKPPHIYGLPKMCS